MVYLKDKPSIYVHEVKTRILYRSQKSGGEHTSSAVESRYSSAKTSAASRSFPFVILSFNIKGCPFKCSFFRNSTSFCAPSSLENILMLKDLRSSNNTSELITRFTVTTSRLWILSQVLCIDLQASSSCETMKCIDKYSKHFIWFGQCQVKYLNVTCSIQVQATL